MFNYIECYVSWSHTAQLIKYNTMLLFYKNKFNELDWKPTLWFNQQSYVGPVDIIFLINSNICTNRMILLHQVTEINCRSQLYCIKDFKETESKRTMITTDTAAESTYFSHNKLHNAHTLICKLILLPFLFQL